MITEKPGVCPNIEGMIGICVELCSDDSDCNGTQKCCSNGCGHVCMKPGKYCIKIKTDKRVGIIENSKKLEALGINEKEYAVDIYYNSILYSVVRASTHFY